MLTPEETQAAVLKALEGRGIGKMPCEVCGTLGWALSDGFVLLPLTPNPLNIMIGGKGLPLAPLTCKTCGNTHLINLVIAGIPEDTLKTFNFKRDEPFPTK